MAKFFYTTAVTLLMMGAFYANAGVVVKKNRKVAHLTARSHKLSLKSLKASKSRSVGKWISLKSREMARSHKEAGIGLSAPDMTSGNMTLAFQGQKGHLLWPMDSRKVIMRFGLQSYIPGVHYDNLGITIAVDKDSTVRAVYDGVVDDVIDIGDAKAVMILHGKYFTIYSDLSKATVVRNQVVRAGDTLGQVGKTGELEFRIYDPYDVWMDPEKWLVHAGGAKGK